jgi:hypothetical protein
MYFTSIRYLGPVRYGDTHGFLGVLECPDDPVPIGVASRVGQTEDGTAVWRLAVRGHDIPGRWVIIDRRFEAVDGDPA